MWCFGKIFDAIVYHYSDCRLLSTHKLVINSLIFRYQSDELIWKLLFSSMRDTSLMPFDVNAKLMRITRMNLPQFAGEIYRFSRYRHFHKINRKDFIFYIIMVHFILCRAPASQLLQLWNEVHYPPLLPTIQVPQEKYYKHASGEF